MTERAPDIIVEVAGRGREGPGRRAPPASAGGGPGEPLRPLAPLLHLALFLLTFLSILLNQAPKLAEASVFAAVADLLARPERALGAWSFALTLMAILVAHEGGHWWVNRRFGVPQSLPFFLPGPALSFGTLGAVIVTRRALPTRAALLRMAAAGPWAGLAVALPAAIWGLAHSTPVEAVEHTGLVHVYGRSLLFGLLEDTFGPGGSDVHLHPVAMAAWAGLFFTSLNLIPVAQLDGGHIAYALLGDRHRRLGRWVLLGLAGVGLWSCTQEGGGPMWLLWAGVLALVGLRHPPVEAPEVPLGGGEVRLGMASLGLFLATFVPLPKSEIYFIDRPASPAPPAAEEIYDL